jgi:small ligand-binding sensory domain FIST
MKWASTIQTSNSFEKSYLAAVAEIKKQLRTKTVDLGILFVSGHYRKEIAALWPSLKSELPFKHLLGCTAGGVIGGGLEEEARPAVSLTAAMLPKVKITPFHFHQDNLPDADHGPNDWKTLVKSTPDENPHFILLTDPFSLDSDALIAGLDFAFPAAAKVGGLASGGTAPNENFLFTDEKVFHKGAVGVALSGDVSVEVVVAQGCRPIGEPLSVTECDKNILLSVNNQSPIEYLQSLYETLPERDQKLLQQSLFLGVLMDAFNSKPKQGDFLIRNIIGLDEKKGILAIGSLLRNGQTVQFHLRDSVTSHDDLKLMLSNSQTAKLKKIFDSKPSQAGAMLFSCLGRGHRLYGEPNHDIKLVNDAYGQIPVGGFFCNGEIGPVGGKTFLHGYTSSIAVFRPAKVKAEA